MTAAAVLALPVPRDGVQIEDLTPGLHDPWPSEDGAEGWNSWSIV